MYILLTSDFVHTVAEIPSSIHSVWIYTRKYFFPLSGETDRSKAIAKEISKKCRVILNKKILIPQKKNNNNKNKINIRIGLYLII